MWWSDLFKLWTYSFEKDPISQRTGDFTGAGVTQPDVIPDIRQDGSFWGGGKGVIRLRDSNDFIDLSSVTNRVSRYKEYQRLRNVPEIETAVTIMADEACIAGHTKIATPFYGFKTIRWLAENKAKERFLVYCWDFKKEDYALGWAFDPRFVKVAPTIKILLTDGTTFCCTEDHRILLRDGTWVEACNLDPDDELMPFYRINAPMEMENNQFPRIFTHRDGWKTERQFIDEWREREVSAAQDLMYKVYKMISSNIPVAQISQIIGKDWKTITSRIRSAGFSHSELKELGKLPKTKKILNMYRHENLEVFDLSVEGHENFCGESVVFHNCQRGEDGHVFSINGISDDIHDELNVLFFNRHFLNMDKRLWNICKNLLIFGDHFDELIIDPDSPKDGVYRVQDLPPDSVYRIETTKGKLIEFQQSNEGPDYQSLTRVPVTQATEADLRQATALRFSPRQIVHWRFGEDRKMFYPYGVSVIEPARGPAHQLRLMEDSMVVYRLCLTGDSRVRTNNGWKYIKDLYREDIVYSFDNKEIATKVIAQMSTGIQKVYKVKSKHVSISGNATHPILVNRDGIIQYVEIQNLIPKKDNLINVPHENEDKINIPRIVDEKWGRLSFSQRMKFRESLYENISQQMRNCSVKTGLKFDRIKQFLYRDKKNLRYEHAVIICDEFGLDTNELIICNKGEIHSERINLPDYVDKDFARLFGFLIGDGSVGRHSVVFACSPNQEQNQKYALLLQKYFGKVQYQPDKRRKSNLGSYCVSSVIACKILKEMGYIPGASNKRIPSWVFQSSCDIRKAFILGLADADASCRQLKSGLITYEFEMCNKQLIEDIKELWHSIGLSSGHIRHRKRNGGHEIESGRKMKSTESWTVYLSEKELPKYERIESIEYIGEEEVYDITVENELHNFIVNGIPVHNSRAPERRVFYIDIGTMAGARAEGFIERIKDQFRKKKVASGKGGKVGIDTIEERWHPPAIDEDYWLPIRQNSNTRIETLPGAQNLGEVDDALYFRNKLFTALQFPKNYLSNEDPNVTRISLSAQDIKFARMIERVQSSLEDGLLQIAETHLELLGIPEEKYENLQIKLTPPSDWRELSRMEILSARINNANSLKGSMLLSDYDILTDWMKYSEDEAQEKIARMKIQKLEDFKLQVLASNPQLLGIGVPSDQREPEIGAEPGGPSPMLGPGMPGEMPGAPPGMPPGAPPAMPPEMPGGMPGAPPAMASEEGPPKLSAPALPEPELEDIKKYDLEIQNYAKEQDTEEIDYSSLS